MKRLLVLMLVGLCYGDEVDIKKLSDTQIKAITTAKAKLDAANAEYNNVVTAVKATYGDVSYNSIVGSLACDVSATTVEIVDKWVIVRKFNMNRCSYTVPTIVEPIK